ncbi:MAG: QueT transporter family protein [Lachnospiraceae bacterium]|nr:QueT transporter family protein [Lachnospiraceae bacterium]
MKQNRITPLFMAQGAAIAALYVVLTLAFVPISFAAVQVRIAEALTILPLFTPAAIPGLFIGCIIANLMGGAIIWDVIFGSIATLIGAYFGYRLRGNRWLVPVPAIISNTVIVPLVLRFGYGVDMPFILLVLSIAAGEIVGCYVLGEILATAMLAHKKEIFPQAG